MKTVKGNNCFGITENDKILFTSSDVLPFLAVKEDDKEESFVQLPVCEVLSEQENEIYLSFKGNGKSVKCLLEKQDKIVTMTFDGNTEKAVFNLHAEKGETIYFADKDFNNVKGKRFRLYKKDITPNAFGKLFGRDEIKTKFITPSYVGNGYGIKVLGKVVAIDFRSPLSTKITVENAQKIIFAFGEERAEIKGLLNE